VLTTPHSSESVTSFEITHPFHPLCGKRFELVLCSYNPVPGRVFYYDESGRIRPISVAWTSLSEPDSFCVVSGGRALFRVEELLELARLIKELKP